MTVLSLLLGLLVSTPALANEPHARAESSRAELSSVGSAATGAPVCMSFARRQMGLADRLAKQSKYQRAVKVLNSTLNNCKKEVIQKKLFSTLQKWFGEASEGSASEFRKFINVVSNQSYITPSQRSKLEDDIKSHLLSLVGQKYRAGEYSSVYDMCERYPLYTNENFYGEYYCGSAGENLGAQGVAMSSYGWLLENWSSEQSLVTWGTLATKLESLYLLNGRFKSAYEIAREIATRNPTPRHIISSLVSIRGNFLEPLMAVSSHFYAENPTDAGIQHIDKEMKRIDFPKYVRAFYIVGSEGKVKRSMYGSEFNTPSEALLANSSQSVSLLQSQGESNHAWLVSAVDDDRHLVLEFGVATTPEENIRLEKVMQRVRSENQWDKLYALEFEKTSPATGSAVGTVLGGAMLGNSSLETYDDIFANSSVLSYFCVQNTSKSIETSYNFDRSNLGYGDDTWERTSKTPALYHHSIKYSGQPVREVVWPNFVDDTWNGVVRVGLVQS